MDEIKRIAGLLLAMALVGGGFVVVLGIGFELNGPVPAGLGEAIPWAAIVMLAGGAGLVAVVRSYGGRWVPPVRVRRRRLPVSPLRDEQRAYANDPEALATCEHLRPIERDMRAHGIKVVLQYGTAVNAECAIDVPAFERRFGTIAPAGYRIYPGDRPGEPESALIVCPAHSSWIGVIHEADARAGTIFYPIEDDEPFGGQ